MDYSLPGSSVHGIFQARVLEWGAIAFSEGLLRQPFYLFAFLFLGDGLDHCLPVQCHESPSIVLQALFLSDLIP